MPRIYKVLARDGKGRLRSPGTLYPPLYYAREQRTVVPSAWEQEGFGIYTYKNRQSAMDYYHYWVDLIKPSDDLYGLSVYWGYGELVDNPNDFLLDASYYDHQYGMRMRRDDPQKVAQIIRYTQAKHTYPAGRCVPGDIHILRDFTPTDDVTAHVSAKNQRKEEAEEGDQRAFAEGVRKTFVQQGYFGYRNRLLYMGPRLPGGGTG